MLLAVEMAIAMWKGEHFFDYPLAMDRYELARALGVGAFALATFGAGSLSLDAILLSKGRSPRGAKSKGRTLGAVQFGGCCSNRPRQVQVVPKIRLPLRFGPRTQIFPVAMRSRGKCFPKLRGDTR